VRLNRKTARSRQLHIVPSVRAHAKNPTRKWHIWFFPTHEPTLKKPKEPFFAKDRQSDNNSNTFYIEKRDKTKIKTTLAA
jgi:hypothetical protein